MFLLGVENIPDDTLSPVVDGYIDIITYKTRKKARLTKECSAQLIAEFNVKINTVDGLCTRKLLQVRIPEAFEALARKILSDTGKPKRKSKPKFSGR